MAGIFLYCLPGPDDEGAGQQHRFYKLGLGIYSRARDSQWRSDPDGQCSSQRPCIYHQFSGCTGHVVPTYFDSLISEFRNLSSKKSPRPCGVGRVLKFAFQHWTNSLLGNPACAGVLTPRLHRGPEPGCGQRTPPLRQRLSEQGLRQNIAQLKKADPSVHPYVLPVLVMFRSQSERQG